VPKTHALQSTDPVGGPSKVRLRAVLARRVAKAYSPYVEATQRGQGRSQACIATGAERIGARGWRTHATDSQHRSASTRGAVFRQAILPA